MKYIFQLLILVILMISQSECIAKDNSYTEGDLGEISETQLRSSVEHLPVRWANALDNPTAFSTDLLNIFSSEINNEHVMHFQFSHFSALGKWYADRRDKLQSSSYEVSNIKLVRLGDKRVKLDFEYIIEEQFKNSPLHIIRLKQGWLIDNSNTSAPVVIEMQGAYLPPRINSGAKIQC